MTTMPETGRQAAHVLLDAVTAFDHEAPTSPANVPAMNLAFERLNDIGAVTATFDDETDYVTLEASQLLGGTAVLVSWLVHQLALATDTSAEEVIVSARAWLDRAD